MSRRDFMGSPGLGAVLADLAFKCLDVGARGGFIEDLVSIGSAVDARGFEPDTEECGRLNEAAARGLHPWRSLQYFPVGLGAAAGVRPLNLYSNRDCASLLEADVELARRFGRDHYFALDRVVEVPVLPLDEAARRHDFTDAVFIKLDVQGAELEILRGGPQLLDSSILGVRTEVEFLPLYRDQPLYTDVDRHLRRAGFLPMAFLELRHWRRDARRAGDSRPPLVFSKAQLVHGDMLFLRDPERMGGETEEEISRLLKLAFLALAYGHVDLAEAVVNRSEVAAALRRGYGVDPGRVVREAAGFLQRQERRARMRSRWRRLRRAAGRVLKFGR